MIRFCGILCAGILSLLLVDVVGARPAAPREVATDLSRAALPDDIVSFDDETVNLVVQKKKKTQVHRYHADTRVQEFFIEGGNPPVELILDTYEVLRSLADERGEITIPTRMMS